MLRHNLDSTDKLELEAHGFLLGIEVQTGTSIEPIMNAFADFLMGQEGVGAVECEHLGQIEVLESVSEPGAAMKES